MSGLRIERNISEVSRLIQSMKNQFELLEKEHTSLLKEVSELREKSTRDDLTKLLRREAFEEKCKALQGYSKRTDLSYGVIMVDIDHFKSVNDKFGHFEGDRVIKELSQILIGFESPQTLVGRFGGEEFILFQIGSREELAMTAELVRKRAEKLHAKNETAEWKGSVSIGISHSTTGSFTLSEHKEKADAALYSAKHSGRNQVKLAA